MKKILLLLVATTVLYSCTKETSEPQLGTEGAQQTISLSFTVDVAEDEPRAIIGSADGTIPTGTRFVDFKAGGVVWANIYVIDKNGLVGRSYKQLTISNEGKKLSYSGEVTADAVTIDKETAKVSIYVGLDNRAEFKNTGFTAIERFGSGKTELPPGYVILKSENNPLVYVSRATSGLYHEYKTKEETLKFTMAGSLFFFRFQNLFKPESRRMKRLPNKSVVPDGAPISRGPAEIDSLMIYNLPVEKIISVKVDNGLTRLDTVNRDVTPQVFHWRKRTSSRYPERLGEVEWGMRQGMPKSYSFPAMGDATWPSKPTATETVFALYSPTLKRSPNDSPRSPIAFSFGLNAKSKAIYAEQREDGSSNFSSKRAVILQAPLKDGGIYVLRFIHTGKFVEKEYPGLDEDDDNTAGGGHNPAEDEDPLP